VIFFVVQEDRSFGFRYFLEDRAEAQRRRFQVLASDRLLPDHSFTPGTYVFTLDNLLPAEREYYGQLWSQLGSHRSGVRLLNDPRETIGRLALLQSLHAAGRSRVQAVRATEPMESLHYPVFLREETGHSGNLTPLLHAPDQVHRALRRLALRGFRRRELLAVEFCDTADARGIYRKYSAYIVGDRVVPRCLEFGRDWMVKHDPGAYDAGRIAEEREYVRSNPHEARLREIFAAASVQYGRIDYALLDGRLQVWEINLNPTIGRHLPRGQESPDVRRVRELRRDTNDIFYTRFLAAWEAVDTETAAQGAIAVHLDSRVWDAARAEREAARRGERHRRAVVWAANQPAVSAAWRLVTRVRPRGKSLLTGGAAPEEP
jgi:hypothetical protein